MRPESRPGPDAPAEPVPVTRILYIIDTARVASGGTEKHLRVLASNLDPERFRPTIVTFDLGEDFRQRAEEDGLEIVHFRLRRIYDFNAMRRAVQLYRLIHAQRPDIVQTFHTKADIFGALVARLAGVEHLVSSRRDVADNKKPLHKKIGRYVNRLFDRVITVCDAVGERVHEWEAVPWSRQRTIYNGVDSERFSPENVDPALVARLRWEHGVSDDAFVVGMVANFRSEKNFDVFLEGVRRARTRIGRLKALAIGAGPTLEGCREFCDRSGLAEVVAFPGRIARVREYLSLMHVACLTPGSNEGFSNSILEKMSMGLPVVATSVGGNAEAIEDGRTGIVIPPGDPQRLAEAIVGLYEDPDRRESMGARARVRAVREFSLEKMIERHEELYHQIMQGQR